MVAAPQQSLSVVHNTRRAHAMSQDHNIHYRVWQNNESQFDPVQVSCGTQPHILKFCVTSFECIFQMICGHSLHLKCALSNNSLKP
jgi:hypothetical protein